MIALIVNVQFNSGGSPCQDRDYLVTVFTWVYTVSNLFILMGICPFVRRVANYDKMYEVKQCTTCNYIALYSKSINADRYLCFIYTE